MYLGEDLMTNENIQNEPAVPEKVQSKHDKLSATIPTALLSDPDVVEELDIAANEDDGA
jgi:hypothetical protein